VTDQRRVPEHVEAAGPTLDDTLARLRAGDATVAEFVAAGGLSSFRPLTHYYVAAVSVDGQPIQSSDANQVFDDLGEAISHARKLSQYARIGVFELVTKAVFE